MVKARLSGSLRFDRRLPWEPGHVHKSTAEGHLIHAKQPRAKRYPFVASVELTQVDSAAVLKEKTSDLSLFGCHIATQHPWSAGTKVRVRISHGGASFSAMGIVAHVQPGEGMGILFTRIGQNEQVVLDRWIAGVRDH